MVKTIIDSGGENKFLKFIFLTLLVLFLLFFFFNEAVGQQVKLSRNDSGADEYFGNAVAVHGDYAIVGAYFDNDNGWGSGSAYIFKKEDNTWNQKQKLVSSEISAYDFFGISVDINNDIAVIGATGDIGGIGAVYVFRKSGESWNEEFKLFPSDGRNGDLFGISLAADNDRIVVGAPGDDMNTGSAYIYEYMSGDWKMKQNIYPNDGTSYDFFGSSVALNAGVLVVGLRGNLTFGAVYVYMQDGTVWENVSKISADDMEMDDQFGSSVDIFQNILVIGARFNDQGGLDCGAAYLYVREGYNWTEQNKIIPADGIENERFGQVAIHNNILAIGANKDDDMGIESGSVYIYALTGNNWNFAQKITAEDGFSGDGFGSSVSLWGNRLIVGAPYDNDGASDAGSAYIIDLSGVTDITHNNINMHDYSLSQNYPNPFNSLTTIEFEIPKAEVVSIIVYDLLGDVVKELVDNNLSAGNYKLEFDGANLPSGVYFYRMKTSDYSKTRKILLLK